MNAQEPRSYFTGRLIASMTTAEVDAEAQALRAAHRLIPAVAFIIFQLAVAAGFTLYLLRP